MAKERILIVEDELGIRELMQLYLISKNYQVFLAESGEEALKLIASDFFHLILLDIEMPRLDGFEVCKQIREKLDLPIIFISSRRDIMDKLMCFELGGDDYITKPFNFEELNARIKANLRRYYYKQKQSSSNMLVYKHLRINMKTYETFLYGEKVPLSKKEMQILIFLAKQPNQVFSLEQIYDQIWGLDSLGNMQTVKVHISNLRRKLEQNPAKPVLIKTVRGFGYQFSG